MHGSTNICMKIENCILYARRTYNCMKVYIEIITNLLINLIIFQQQASQTIKSDTGSEMEGQAPVNVEGQQYVEAKSYVMLEICLSHPLIPKRPPEELARR